ncbi:MAG: glutaminyl-peptide cyclotransferase, partial [Chloroflexota bacterium]
MSPLRIFQATVVIPLTIALLVVGCASPAARDGDSSPGSTSGMMQGTPSASVAHYSYDVLNVYAHDEAAFTQGLAFADGTLYEGTGRRGESSLRAV